MIIRPKMKFLFSFTIKHLKMSKVDARGKLKFISRTVVLV